MHRAIYIIAIFILTFTVMASEKVIANDIRRDAVFASEGKQYGNGSIRDITQYDGSITLRNNIGVKTVEKRTIDLPPNIPDCALNNEKFREEYTKLYKAKYSGTSYVSTSANNTVKQKTHIYIQGDDASKYEPNTISIEQINEPQVASGWCYWARDPSRRDLIYQDEFSVVFLEDFNNFEGSFQCSQKLVMFCSANMTFGERSFYYASNKIVVVNKGNHQFSGSEGFYGSNSTYYIGEGNHVFSGNNLFNKFNGSIYIAGGEHKFTGSYLFKNSYGKLEIGDGKGSEFTGSYMFYDQSGNIFIGSGNHVFNTTSFYYTSDEKKYNTGNFHLGKGEHKFIDGGSYFYLNKGMITIEGGPISFVKSSNSTYGARVFIYNKGDINIGYGNIDAEKTGGFLEFNHGSINIGNCTTGHKFPVRTGSYNQGSIKIGDADKGGHTFGNGAFRGENKHIFASGTIDIGNGNHIFGYQAFLYSNGYINIGNGNHKFDQQAFINSHSIVKIGYGKNTYPVASNQSLFGGTLFHNSYILGDYKNYNDPDSPVSCIVTIGNVNKSYIPTITKNNNGINTIKIPKGWVYRRELPWTTKTKVYQLGNSDTYMLIARNAIIQ